MTLPAPGDPNLVRWRYHFTDFRTARVLATLPLVGASFDDLLNGPGAGSGSIPLSVEVRKRDPFSATVTRRSCLWAERQTIDPGGTVIESAIPWAGVVMSRDRSHGGRAMKLGCVSWAGYFAHRLVGSRRHRQVDRFTIMRDLFSWGVRMPAGVYGLPSTGVSPHLADLVPITGAGLPLSGVKSDRTYLASDRKPVLAAATELADSGAGFDWRLVPYMGTPGDLSTLRVRLVLGYPRLGRTGAAAAELRWSTDRRDMRSRWGHVSALSVTENGSGVHNRVYATGAGTGADQVTAVAQAVETGRDELGAGYPLYESSLSSSTEDDRTYDTVYGKAYGALLAGFASEVTVSGIRVRGDLAPTLTRYEPGDDATIRVGESITGQPTTIVGQIVGRKIEPGEQGGVEQVTLDVQASTAAVEPPANTTRKKVVRQAVTAERFVKRSGT